MTTFSLFVSFFSEFGIIDKKMKLNYWHKMEFKGLWNGMECVVVIKQIVLQVQLKKSFISKWNVYLFTTLMLCFMFNGAFKIQIKNDRGYKLKANYFSSWSWFFKVRITLPELPPTLLQYSGHVYLSVSHVQYTALSLEGVLVTCALQINIINQF